MLTKKAVLALGLFVAVTWLAAIAGILSSQNAPVVYAKIVQPSWAPPAWLFGPVWTVLYVMMALAAWRVWLRTGMQAPVKLYLIHLIFQGAWSWLFFGIGRADLAFLDIAVLWALILGLTVWFWRIDRLAAGLMIPYLAWVSFAMTLNGALWQLNGGHLPR